MKRLLILLILLLATPCYSAGLMTQIVGAGGGAAAAFCTTSTSCSTNDCSLLCEDFQGSTNCVTGSSPYCRSTWSSTGTFTTQTFNYSTSPAPLEGTLSYYADSGGAATRITHSISASGTVYGFLAFNAGVAATGLYSTDLVIKLLNGAAGNAYFGYTQSSAGVYKWSAACGGAAATSSAFTFSTGTTYYIWVYYKKGSGADAECQMDIYSDKGKVTQVATTGLKNTGTSTTDVDNVELFAGNGSLDQVIDDAVKIHTSAIGGQSW